MGTVPAASDQHSPESASSPVAGVRRLALLAVLPVLLIISACTQDAGSNPAPAKQGKQRGAPAAHLVELASAERRPLRLSQVHLGSLKARRIVRLHTQEAGRITALPNFEGDAVRRGDVLIRLDRTLLATELVKARAMRQEAEANLKRLNRLQKSKMVAEDEVLRARTALDVARAEEVLLDTRLSYTIVEAPFDGVISERLAEPGDIAERFDHVLTLMDPSSLVADLQVSEMLMPHVHPGSPVQVRIDALGDRTLDGRVIRVHPGLDPSTRQGRVEVEIKPTPAGARAGQFARVNFQLDALERLVIPFMALRRDTGGEYVFQVRPDGTVAKIAVRGGRRIADRVEILEGLEDGARVVTRGFLGLKPDMQVKPVSRSSS